eukprot:GHVQ01025723.1.p1 GENE.GHVQ01025723.1~~GHVQ01025723.1.p1  ORF type:complete len:650 (-),score=137.07 GHVQ01025723.1:154-2103(-)
MEARSLKVCVSGYDVNEIACEYVLDVSYKSLRWTSRKRYSDFDRLHHAILDSGYVLTAALPPKTMFSRPKDTRTINERQRRLQLYLQVLLARPDIRCCPTVLDFLQFTDYTNISVEELKVELLALAGGGKYAITTCEYSQSLGGLIVGMEDNTRLCKLGKVWSLVEAEHVGAFTVFYIDGPDTATPCNISGSLETSFAHKCRAIHYDEAAKKLFCGLEDGRVVGYEFPEAPLHPKLVHDMDVHTEAVVCWGVYNRYVLSVGFDCSIRLIDLIRLKICSGGRLAKRLRGTPDAGLLTVCLLGGEEGFDTHRKRNPSTAGGNVHSDVQNNPKLIAFFGSTHGELLVYRVDCNPPTHVESIQVDRAKAGLTALALSDCVLFVGHGNTVSCWKTPPTSALTAASPAVDNHTYKLTPEVNYYSRGSDTDVVTCITPNKAAGRLLVGYESGAVFIWSLLGDSCLLLGTPAHMQKISSLTLSPWADDVYTTGSDDGTIKIWRLPPSNDPRWECWTVQNDSGSVEDERDYRDEQEEEKQQQQQQQQQQQPVASVYGNSIASGSHGRNVNNNYNNNSSKCKNTNNYNNMNNNNNYYNSNSNNNNNNSNSNNSNNTHKSVGEGPAEAVGGGGVVGGVLARRVGREEEEEDDDDLGNAFS